jgi:chromosomal replication initiation ATPase DnaA
MATTATTMTTTTTTTTTLLMPTVGSCYCPTNNNKPKRRLDFGSVAVAAPDNNDNDNNINRNSSDIRRTELGHLLNYAIPSMDANDDDNENHTATTTSSLQIHGQIYSDHHNHNYVTHEQQQHHHLNIKSISCTQSDSLTRSAVWIEAEAGVGKSYLLHQFQTAIKSTYCQRVVTVCSLTRGCTRFCAKFLIVTTTTTTTSAATKHHLASMGHWITTRDEHLWSIPFVVENYP